MTLFADPRDIKKDALPEFLLQAIFVILVTRLLGDILKYVKQPAVIGQIFGGVVLGPSLLGKWHLWNTTIFPAGSLGGFTLVANVGLIFFMFLMGLELDVDVMRKHLKKSLSIALVGIIVPFILGILMSIWLYDTNSQGHFINVNDSPAENHTVDRTAFLLFCGASLAFTAFPVLASILTSADLLNDPLGVLSLSAAAISDVVAWCVLAFVSSFASSTEPINGLYTSLITLAFILFMLLIIKPILREIHIRHIQGNFHRFVSGYILVLLISSFFCQSIGIHAFFGSFIAGIVVPKDGDFVTSLAPKLEMLVVDFLLPLYFAASGLRTDLGSISSGKYVGISIAVIILATAGKFIPCCLTAKLVTKKDWNYAVAVGVLMNTRGLVELIALNIGLDLGVLSTEMFTVLVIMALVTTFLTSPLLYYVYLRHNSSVNTAKVLPTSHNLAAQTISNNNTIPMTITLEEETRKSTYLTSSSASAGQNVEMHAKELEAGVPREDSNNPVIAEYH